MKILVFGANGKVGSLVVKKCLEQGHTVTAFVRGNHIFQPSQNLTIVQGDIYDTLSVEKVIPNHDAVISCLGSWGTPRKDILATAMRAIVPTMEAHGIQRLISLTGGDARAPGDSIDLSNRIMHPIFSMIAPKIMKDGEEHIEIISKSRLDWTVLRSPVMNDKGNTAFVLHDQRPKLWNTINRNAVAVALVNLATMSDHLKASPYIQRA